MASKRIRVEVVALAIGAVVIRIWIAGAPVERVELGIVGAGHPRPAAAAREHVGGCGPGLAAALTGIGDRRETPDALARRRIVGVEEPSRRILAAGNADDHLAVDHERRERRGVADLVVGEHGVPEDAAGRAIEREQVRVERDHEQPMIEHAEAAIHRRLRAVGEIGGKIAPIGPERPACARIERPRVVVRSGDVEHVVPEQWRCLEPASARRRAGLERPFMPETGDVSRIDLRERAVAPAGVVARERQPA